MALGLSRCALLLCSSCVARTTTFVCRIEVFSHLPLHPCSWNQHLISIIGALCLFTASHLGLKLYPRLWRLRTWMDSSYIVEMNALLREPHERRIRRTPFKWCFDIGSPLKVNLKLLKEMVCRWVGHHQCFRVSQHMVPFNVLDVFMTFGLEIGGLDVPNDESLVSMVGGMFNPKTTTLKELRNMFDMIVHNDEIEVDVVCRLYLLVCFVVFYFPRKSMYVSNMPCAMLDDLDCLGQYDWASTVCFKWYLRPHDRLNPLCRVTFHMNQRPMPKGSMAEGSRAEEAVDAKSDDDSWEATIEDRMRKNNKKLRKWKEKIASLKEELHEFQKSANLGDDRPSGHDSAFMAVASSQFLVPAPAPTSDGTSVDQAVAYVLMLVALVLTYIMH
ncbi:Arabinogalactan peptide 16 [Vigna angularis]|uniref:Arabinogalactan peptide 16 n=1 Tax=Phaseolus angularis TaxID=3914 RepID=A0A8T0JYA3_PHAAN|nr:Arabinogalactan peptide 16 [Vigna angularis]